MDTRTDCRARMMRTPGRRNGRLAGCLWEEAARVGWGEPRQGPLEPSNRGQGLPGEAGSRCRGPRRASLPERVARVRGGRGGQH